MRYEAVVPILLCVLGLGAAVLAAPAGKVLVYVGTYTGAESKGIYRLELDLATGLLAPVGEPTVTVSPSFLALHPTGRFLYAVNETGASRREKTGTVSAFAVDPATGALSFLNQQPSAGASPCHLSFSSDGEHLLVANYGSGSVAVLPVEASGRLGAATAVVEHAGPGKEGRDPHAHAIHLDASNQFAFVADLGLDAVLAYRFDRARGTLTPHTLPSTPLPRGAGPRHFTFDKSFQRAYVINELDSTVTAFAYDATRGALEALQTVSTLPGDFKGKNSTAEVALHPNGRFLYGSNRGHDSLALFGVDATTGALVARGHQKTLGSRPRHFAIDPTGSYLLAANQGSDTIVVFRIDERTGGLTPVGAPTRVPSPVCLRMVRR